MRQGFVLIGAALVLAASVGARGQADPNAAPPDFQQMRDQILQNMQQQGISPQDIANQIRSQVQNGTFDPQQFQQQLQQQGIVTPEMISQFQGGMQQMQQQMQQRGMQNRASALRYDINMSDEEWQIIEPRVQRIQQLLADLNQLSGNNRNNFFA